MALALWLAGQPASAAWPPECSPPELTETEGPDEEWASDRLRQGGPRELEFDFSLNGKLDNGIHSIRATFLERLLRSISWSCLRPESVSIKNVRVAGDFVLTGTRMDHDLTIEWATFDGTARFFNNSVNGKIQISNTAFLKHFDLSENDFHGSLILRNSAGTSVSYKNNGFHSLVTMANNSMEALSFQSNLICSEFNIVNNEIEHGLRISDNAHINQNLASHTLALAINVTGNQVEGNFNFSPMLVDSSVKSVQLGQNMIGGAMRVELPFQLLWSDGVRYADIWDDGSLSLANTTVASSLSIQRFFYRYLDPTSVGRSSTLGTRNTPGVR